MVGKGRKSTRNYAEEKLKRDTFFKVPLTGGGFKYVKKR
jgi:hypothetical protein